MISTASNNSTFMLSLIIIIIGVILFITAIIVLVVSLRKNKRKKFSGSNQAVNKKEYDFFDTPPKRDIFDLNGDGSYEDEADFSKGFQTPNQSSTQVNVPTCPGCGSPLDGGEKFCPYCGKNFR